ncbi:MAG: SAM-dependent methyltransferase, partial [Pseudomonas graminis]
DPSRAETRLRWQALAQGIDTLVFLMAVGRLGEIAAQLVGHGRPADTPAALIRWGTTPDQETVTGTLATIAADATRAGLTAPALLVVGEVVRLRERLSWFDTLEQIAPSAQAVEVGNW